MIIRTRDGIEIGRVRGRRDLSTADASLRQLWDNEIKPVRASDDSRWLEVVAASLGKAGYLAEICD
jgi:hypothetical protein